MITQGFKLFWKNSKNIFQRECLRETLNKLVTCRSKTLDFISRLLTWPIAPSSSNCCTHPDKPACSSLSSFENHKNHKSSLTALVSRPQECSWYILYVKEAFLGRGLNQTERSVSCFIRTEQKAFPSPEPARGRGLE